MGDRGRIVVVGASAAGLTAAESLRREGHDGTITIVGSEDHPPYDRPPLSKQILSGIWDASKVILRSEAALSKLDAEWLLGRTATGMDLAARTISLSTGEVVSFDGAVIATGVIPRVLDPGPALAGVHILRTLDDAIELRSAMLAARSLVIVGAGFLGAEVAAVARSLGLSVTMVDPLPAPMIRQLGERVGGMLARLHVDHGVDLRCGVGVTGMESLRGRVRGVCLSDGTEAPADVVLVAIGCIPAVSWLSDSGLSLSDGVDCDEFCEAAPGVVAAGDVASWLDPDFGRIRVEHRMNATEQALAAAGTLLGKRVPFSPVHYFWSDQYDVKLQAYGMTGSAFPFHLLSGDRSANRFAGIYTRNGRVAGALTWNMPKEGRALRQQVVDRTPVDQLLEGSQLIDF